MNNKRPTKLREIVRYAEIHKGFMGFYPSAICLRPEEVIALKAEATVQLAHWWALEADNVLSICGVQIVPNANLERIK